MYNKYNASWLLKYHPSRRAFIRGVYIGGKLRKKEARARGPLTANAAAGRVSAANNPEGIDSGITANEGIDSGITANEGIDSDITANAAAGRVSAAKIVALDKKIPWGLIATAGAITIAALKK